jgi:pimeloyl-ACP methyl ester carboxylesterase
VINGGEGDITKDWVIQPLLDHIPNAQHHKFEYSTHTPFLEEWPAYMKVVGDFLKS